MTQSAKALVLGLRHQCTISQAEAQLYPILFIGSRYRSTCTVLVCLARPLLCLFVLYMGPLLMKWGRVRTNQRCSAKFISAGALQLIL